MLRPRGRTWARVTKAIVYQPTAKICQNDCAGQVLDLPMSDVTAHSLAANLTGESGGHLSASNRTHILSRILGLGQEAVQLR